MAGDRTKEMRPFIRYLNAFTSQEVFAGEAGRGLKGGR
jgi:hypothetical protein